MKAQIIIAVSFAIIGSVFATTQPIIMNTKETGTLNGKDGDYCAFEEIKIWPGENYNEPGRCGIYQCWDDFSIRILPCPFDITGKYEWVNQDNTKKYPDCCGDKVERSVV
jgi:Single domain von Willebrand factor type C